MKASKAHKIMSKPRNEIMVKIACAAYMGNDSINLNITEKEREWVEGKGYKTEYAGSQNEWGEFNHFKISW